MKRYLISLLLWLPALLPAAQHPPVVHHEMAIRLIPQQGRITVRDTLTLPRPESRLDFLLHDGLRPSLPEPQGRLKRLEPVNASVPAHHWRLQLEKPTRRIELAWSGVIVHPPEVERLHATPGTISEKGAQLSGATLWYPEIPGHLVRFRLALTLPGGWHGISQGKGTDDLRTWEETQPQAAIHLVAGPYHLYRRKDGEREIQAWLLEPDEALAGRYLEATGRYLALYEKLIGPYPYAKFALVENFWPSGYGMPSFTLLGGRLLRLPFILYSSYPHEILHNWWGNSVYVDWASGNWSEGLTAYLADHLLQERQGKGAQYRRDLLLKYAHWVKAGNDIPLVRFRARHGEASQAAGYGRMAMVMHMLRRKLGDRLFFAGLRRFYRDNRFAIAAFDDLRTAFEKVSGLSLAPFFRQWTTRTGAPRLRLSRVRVRRSGQGWEISGLLEQTQPQPPFRLEVPLSLQLEGASRPRVFKITLASRQQAFRFRVENRPARLRVDPDFDLFRQLDEAEIPPSLGGLFSADSLLLVLPDKAPEKQLAAYRALARAWQARYRQLKVVTDGQLKALPQKGAVWILGLENRFAGQVIKALPQNQARLDDEALVVKDNRHPLNGGSLALAAGRRPLLGLLVLGDPEQAASLARRLPHYGKYGYLLFDDQGKNRLKGQWSTGGGALEARFPP